ncbi:type VII secretion-associated serine protease mycosin [Streptomyces muensis]|uniref:Type VII secretion-associated serine protease mycosin n=1 Tax=Streptomyces muensis TaxID=1077944 RepID=A0A9X1Q225_STRM4|nr:type VII secretion-associated serine protease mycosin [Streptomyces muensis]MCF1596630.1 type VII secretion-associated serine protease mycosin [Streptomyces muensis]
MSFKRVSSTAGVMAMTGALLLTSAPTASADYIRDRQWVIDVIDFKKVWAESQGEGVTVAVVDTGVDGSHPDLTGQVLKGMDVTGSGDAQDDTNGHGTGMASLIAGHGHGTNSSAGVVGLAPKAKILPIKASSTGDDYRGDQWAEGVRYAVDEGADVINLSFADPSAVPDSKGAEAIDYALQHDVVVVSGTGNDGITGVEYPAKLPGMVAVGAIDESLKVWKKSNFGPGVTLAAPGVNIARADTTESSGYAEGSGVSDATAYVSATAALVRAKYPDLTAGQVINRLIKSATFLDEDVKKVPDEQYGYGIIRPYAALTKDIPKGPKQGPLAQSSPSTSTNSGAASDDNDSTSQVAKKKKSSSGSILLIAGIAGAVVVLGILFAVIRSRRNGGSSGSGSGSGTPSHGTGYPPQPPTGYQQYPNTAPNQGYPTPPGQSPQQPNPYTQQPPHQGQ